jgi:hypothetical protein
MDSAITNSIGTVPAATGYGSDGVEPETIDQGIDLEKCFVQNDFGPPPDPEFEAGRPWSPPPPDPFVAAFNECVRQAKDLEAEILDIENEEDELLEDAKGRLGPLQQQQIVACFRAWQLVTDNSIPTSVMETYALEAGERAHGNEKIPSSRLTRAIVTTGVAKGTKAGRRKRARASTYASAIDYGIREGMTPEEFAAELNQPRKRGERHGIEYLAEQGRRARRAATFERSTDEVADALTCLHDGEAFVVSGDFSGIAPGYRLVVVNVPLEGTITETRGQIIDPANEANVQRLLRQWIKARRTAETANIVPSPAQYDLAGSLGELAKTVNSMRLM